MDIPSWPTTLFQSTLSHVWTAPWQALSVVDEALENKERLCLLIEKGSFWGMGYLPEKAVLSSSGELKHFLNPYADNDYIRNSIYAFAEANPGKRFDLGN